MGAGIRWKYKIYFWHGRRIGRLAPGYEASLLVLDANPLAEFSNVKRIRLRMKQGELIQIGPNQ
jgi:imidazolonepropionase-like amidohydrolase